MAAKVEPEWSTMIVVVEYGAVYSFAMSVYLYIYTNNNIIILIKLYFQAHR